MRAASGRGMRGQKAHEWVGSVRSKEAGEQNPSMTILYDFCSTHRTCRRGTQESRRAQRSHGCCWSTPRRCNITTEIEPCTRAGDASSNMCGERAHSGGAAPRCALRAAGVDQAKGLLGTTALLRAGLKRRRGWSARRGYMLPLQ